MESRLQPALPESLIPNPQSLLSSATTPDGTVNYTYDADGQLTGATYSNPQSLIPNPSESYTYDANGNRTGGGYVTGADNELLSDGTYNYQYDADGNRIERTNIATGAVTDYVWDNRDRLVEVIDRTSAGGAITQDVHYFYDAQNRWIGETVSVPGASGPGDQLCLRRQPDRPPVRRYANSPLPSGEGQGEGGFASPLTVANLSHRYLWGPAVDQILGWRDSDQPHPAGQRAPAADQQRRNGLRSGTVQPADRNDERRRPSRFTIPSATS